MSPRRAARTVVIMFHDPTSRRLIAEARREELQRHAKPLAIRDPADEGHPPRARTRLRRLFSR